MAGFAAVGFVDDWRKLTIPKSMGISAASKMIGLTIVTCAVLAAWLYYVRTTDRLSMISLYFPVVKEWEIPLEADVKWPEATKQLHAEWWNARISRQQGERCFRL